MHYDYIIVGAGIYGATLAHLLHEKTMSSVLVIDKRPYIGGNCHTEYRNDIEVHTNGAHIFHTDNEIVWDFVNKFSSFLPYIHNVVAKGWGKVYNLPFNLNTFNQIWGISDPNEAQRKISDEIMEQYRNGTLGKLNNLETKALSLVGRTIYKILIKCYTEKQWGCKCSELPEDIITRLPIRYTFNNNYFNDRYQGIPEVGYTKLIENMLDGIEVKLGCDFLKHKNEFEYDKLIYTGSIDEFFDYKFGNLEYRSLNFETSIVDVDNYQGNSVVNYVDDSVPFTRIIEHKHFRFSLNNSSTIITKEYSVPYQLGMERYYPINNNRNMSLYSKYLDYARKVSPNVLFGGRLGKYKYLDMDDAISYAMIDFSDLTHR